MIEARITCLCIQLGLPTLGLKLVRDQVEWIGEKTARVSEELAHFRCLGAVRVEYIERCRMHKPIPGWRPARRKDQPKENQNREASVSPELVQEVQDLTQSVCDLKVSLGSLQGVLLRQEAEAEKQRELQAAKLSELDGAICQLVAVLSGEGRSFHSKPSSQVETGESDPVFIPSDIVNKEQEVEVASASGDGSQLEASAAKLKELRSEE